MTKTALDDLWDELDLSALKLLRQAMGVGGGALPAEGGEVTLPPAGGSLNERVRVFSAISAYAKSRQEAGPQGPKSGKSGFDDLREQFRGVGPSGGQRGPTKRGARSGKEANLSLVGGSDTGSGNGGGNLPT